MERESKKRQRAGTARFLGSVRAKLPLKPSPRPAEQESKKRIRTVRAKGGDASDLVFGFDTKSPHHPSNVNKKPPFKSRKK
jgi:hypothetical protein